MQKLTQAATDGSGNLLAISIEAARNRATVGEISEALEKVYGRYQATATTVSGVYKGEISDDSLEEIQGVITEFVEEEGTVSTYSGC